MSNVFKCVLVDEYLSVCFVSDDVVLFSHLPSFFMSSQFASSLPFSPSLLSFPSLPNVPSLPMLVVLQLEQPQLEHLLGRPLQWDLDYLALDPNKT